MCCRLQSEILEDTRHHSGERPSELITSSLLDHVVVAGSWDILHSG